MIREVKCLLGFHCYHFHRDEVRWIHETHGDHITPPKAEEIGGYVDRCCWCGKEVWHRGLWFPKAYRQE